MSNLLIVNFGTISETNRFKKNALRSKFVTLTVSESKSSFPFEKGGRFVEDGEGTKVTTFYNLPDQEFRRKRTQFKQGYEAAISKANPHCVYLTGHHAGFKLWGGPKSCSITLSMQRSDRNRNRFRFRLDDQTEDVADIDLTPLRQNCLVVIGMGCNICTAGASAYYQGYFKNGARKSIILGFSNTIRVPRSATRNIVTPFFNYIQDVITALPRGNNVAPPPSTNFIEYLYRNHPLEIVKAWGYANYEYRKHHYKSARARDNKGDYYKYGYNKATKEIVLVKA